MNSTEASAAARIEDAKGVAAERQTVLGERVRSLRLPAEVRSHRPGTSVVAWLFALVMTGAAGTLGFLYYQQVTRNAAASGESDPTPSAAGNGAGAEATDNSRTPAAPRAGGEQRFDRVGGQGLRHSATSDPRQPAGERAAAEGDVRGGTAGRTGPGAGRDRDHRLFGGSSAGPGGRGLGPAAAAGIGVRQPAGRDRSGGSGVSRSAGPVAAGGGGVEAKRRIAGIPHDCPAAVRAIGSNLFVAQETGGPSRGGRYLDAQRSAAGANRGVAGGRAAGGSGRRAYQVAAG